MQPRIFFQILRQNQFSFFGSCVYKKYFSNSAESITWVKKTIEIAFINLIWSGIPSFNFQVDDSTLNLRIHSQTLGFNFSTQGLFELEESLLNYGSQSWMWGFNLKLTIQSWTAGLKFGFWILDFGFRNSDFGFWILEFWILEFGFQVLDGRFGILDCDFFLKFGFWISELGIGICDFGIWILNFNFGIWHLDLWIWNLNIRIWI